VASTPAHLESELWLNQPIALWQRINDRIEERMLVVERSVVVLLERSLRAEEIEQCIQECKLVSDWVFSLDLVVAGRIVRDISTDFSSAELSGQDAPGLAGRLEDLRNVLRVASDDWMDRTAIAGHVHVVSQIDARIDAMMWNLQKGGMFVTHSTRFAGSPVNADVMVLYPPRDSRDAAPALSEIGRRSARTRRVILHPPDEPQHQIAEVAALADVVLSVSSPSSALAEEIHLVGLPDPAWSDRVVLLGADEVVADLDTFSFWSIVAADIDEAMDLLTSTERTLIVGPGVTRQASVVSLLRSNPATRNTVVVVLATDDVAALQCRQVGADIVAGHGETADNWAIHLRGLLSRERLLMEDEPPDIAEIPSWASTLIIFERALTSMGRSGSGASLAVIGKPDDLSPADLQALREAIAREFRAADLLGESEEGLLMVLLRGATREAATARIQLALKNLQITTTPGRAGVAEYPIDGYGLTDLMTSATQAADRSRAASGPPVAASDWYSESADQADVVLVESDFTLASILIQLLDHLGLRSRHVLTGSDALRLFSGGSQAKLPKLILLELDAMGADGLMILRSLASHGVMSRTKVIVTCARIRDGELREAFELGADDVVVKPFSAVVLSNRIRQVLDDR
jgi:CheY-like chemotaxis protein